MPQPVLITELSAVPGIAHGFFTRRGGISAGLYASLNCGTGSKDDPASVRENRARVTAHLGARKLVSVHQVHSATAVVVEDRSVDDRPKADAMVTAVPGLALGVLTADCAPILLADLHTRVVGAAHAGWRGALAGIAEAVLQAMEGLGAARERIHAAVGPCIGPDAYEVGPEFEAEFLAHDPANTRFFAHPDALSRPYFNLPGYIALRLQQAGCAGVTVANACCCTLQEDYFSYRRSRVRGEADYGRQISAIVLT